LRIISGQFGGRTIRVPKGDIRPTQDKVREAIFSSLAPVIPGARVLDIFAGSGAMGLEAWSRGAAWVWWVEKNRQIFKTLQQNVGDLCGADALKNCFCMDAMQFLQKESAVFDVVFCDPPYREGAESRQLESLLNLLGKSPSLIPGGLLVYEHGAKEAEISDSCWELKRSKTYGKTGVLIYQKIIKEKAL